MSATTIHYPGRWAVVTGASSGLGRGIAARLADRGMSLVLTGRNEARLHDTAREILRAAPRVKVETVAADLSARSGVSKLLDHVGDRPIEVLVNNAGFGSYGPVMKRKSARSHGWAASTSARGSMRSTRRCSRISPEPQLMAERRATRQPEAPHGHLVICDPKLQITRSPDSRISF